MEIVLRREGVFGAAYLDFACALTGQENVFKAKPKPNRFSLFRAS